MVTVWIPALLRSMTGGVDKVQVDAGTVGEVVDRLDERFPGIRARLCENGELRPGIAAAVDTQLAPQGVRQPVPDGGEVHFLPAISGG